MTLTKQDLADLQASNDRVITVLKDVALQFNSICKELALLARADEDIVNTLMERVFQPLASLAKDHGLETKDFEKEFSKALEKATDDLKLSFKDAISSASKTVDESAKKITEHQIQCNNCYKIVESTGKELAKHHLDTATNKASTVVVITAFAALATLIATIFNLFWKK